MMGTRCQICLHNRNRDEPIDKAFEKLPAERTPGVILYHHSDGMPNFQIPKLFRFLWESFARYTALGYGWFDAEKIGGMMIFLSAAEYDKPGLFGKLEAEEHAATEKKREEYRKNPAVEYVPQKYRGYPEYIPTAALHGDIAFLYDVFLTGGDFTIIASRVEWPDDDDKPAVLVEIGRVNSDAKDIQAEADEIEKNKSKPAPKKRTAKTSPLQKFVKAVTTGNKTL
jgi:hypothetical protein